MQIYVISDNHDTKMGMRLCGIDGIVVHEREEFCKVLAETVNNREIGIILVTEKLVKLAPDYVSSLKLSKSLPLIVEIPDRHGPGRTKDAISNYISQAIGVKL